MVRTVRTTRALVAIGLAVLVVGFVVGGSVEASGPFFWAFVGFVFAGMTLDTPDGYLASLPRAGLVLVGALVLGIGQAVQTGQQLGLVLRTLGGAGFVIGLLDDVATRGSDDSGE